jgi:hypothetical protein
MKYGDEAVWLLIDRLNEIGADYMIVGSFSSNAYGIARSTKDADFVVQIDETIRRKLLAGLPADFKIENQVSFETVTGHRRQILNIPKIPYVIELFDLSDEAFDQSRFERRVKTTMAGRTAWLPSASDVVIQKLRWATLAKRSQDMVDATNVIKVSGEFLDWPYIERWCGELGIRAALEEAREAALMD